MDTIKLDGAIYRGTHYGSVGVYTDRADGSTYAGGREGGVAHGEGVLTWSHGTTYSGQLADGDWHGHREYHCADADVYYYQLYERGNKVHTALVRSDGACFYDNKLCRADHAGLAKLKAAAQQAGVRMPPARIQRNARAVTRRTRRFGFRTALGFGASSRPAAFGMRLQACACVCVRASVCACPCACVYLCMRVHARSGVRG
jgi:hypothetical protein